MSESSATLYEIMDRILPKLWAIRTLLIGVLSFTAAMDAVAKSFEIRGTCVDPNGAPVSGIMIRLMEVKSAGLMRLPDVVEKSQMETDERGRFSFCVEKRDGWVLQVHEEPASWRNVRFTLPKGALSDGAVSATISVKGEKVSIKWASVKREK